MARNLLTGPKGGNGCRYVSYARHDSKAGVSAALCAVQYVDAVTGAQSSRKMIEYVPNSSGFMHV
jgi:hypothetical protein